MSQEQADMPPPLRKPRVMRSAGVVSRREDMPSWERLPDLVFQSDHSNTADPHMPNGPELGHPQVFMQPYHSRWEKTDYFSRNANGAPPPLTPQNSTLTPQELDALPDLSVLGAVQPAELKYSGH